MEADLPDLYRPELHQEAASDLGLPIPETAVGGLP
jgi:hypothetical protein